MQNSGHSISGLTKCPHCGLEIPGTANYCLSCGAPLTAAKQEKKVKGRGRTITFIIISVVIAALMAGGVFAAVILLDRPAAVKLPSTEAELRESVSQAELYLNDEGKKLLGGKQRDAPVYSIDAKLDTKEKSISGEQAVLFTNRSEDELTEIVFRIYANDQTVRGSGRPVSVTDSSIDGRKTDSTMEGSLLRLKLPHKLSTGKSTVAKFSFKEYVPEIQTGISGLIGAGEEGGYGIFGTTNNTYNLGHWVPVIASYRNGSWESREVPPFGDVCDYECSYYTVCFDVPDGFKVAATGVPVSEDRGGGRHVHCFTGGPVRDFAIQASTDYEVKTRKVNSTLVSSYYLKNSPDYGGKVLDFTSNALTQFSKHFGPYPYTRLNVCEAPMVGGAAGMEFPGQVLLAQMLYGDFGLEGMDLPESLEDLGQGLEDLLGGLGGELLGNTLEFVTAHEVGHQWWALGVGNDSIGQPWLDESLTNYCAVLYFRWQHGEETAKKELEMELLMPYSMGSMFGGDMVVDSPMSKFKSSEQYTAVVYSKGALFFDALEEQMGSEAFEQSLKVYYRKYAFLDATGEDLIECFKANSQDPGSVQALYQRWIKEVHGDEDIAITLPDLPGMEYLEELLDKLRGEGGIDLGPLEDLLRDFLDAGDTIPELIPDSEPAPVI